MADELMLEIVTPERVIFRGVVDEVTIPGTEGEFGVLKGHAPLLSSVACGELSFLRNQQKTCYAVDVGYAEVSASKTTVLVESAERCDMIDQERAKRAKEVAQEKLARLSREDLEFEKARLALIRAVTRLNVATKG
jgi:F-type H+-transporting ATPase subunit epsilon